MHYLCRSRGSYRIFFPIATVLAYATVLAWASNLSGNSRNDSADARRLGGEPQTCEWPIDLSLERDGAYSDRRALAVSSGVRGRSGNAIIQYMVGRLQAAGQGGFTPPWSGLVQMELEGGDALELGGWRGWVAKR